jgi:hypothetical protein
VSILSTDSALADFSLAPRGFLAGLLREPASVGLGAGETAMVMQVKL